MLTTSIRLYIISNCQSGSVVRQSGDDGIEETLLPIPNRKVKLYSANGTARETVWESRTLPGNMVY